MPPATAATALRRDSSSSRRARRRHGEGGSLAAYNRARNTRLRQQHLPFFMNGCFWLNNVMLRGLTAPLRERFWPDYRLPPGESQGVGRRGGTAVHTDLAACAVDPGRAPRHDMSRRVLAEIRALGWVLVQPEVAVAYGRLGTAADLLVKEASGRLRVIEVKTGMDHALEGGEGGPERRLAPPLQDYLSCPLHHAYLQCAATCLMFRSTYRRPVSFSVVAVSHTRLRIYTPPWEKKLQDFTRAVRDWLVAAST